MKQATISDLRYRFKKLEHLLSEGEEIEIIKRNRVIARLVPAEPAKEPRRPDFKANLKKIYGDKMLKVSGAELLARERTRY